MRGLAPGIHIFLPEKSAKTWMAGTSPAMTPSSCLLEAIETASLQWDLQHLPGVHDAERVEQSP